MKYRLLITLEVDIEVDHEIEDPRFYFEEHRCVDDFLDIALSDVEGKGTCNCYRADIRLLHDGRSEVLELMKRRKHTSHPPS